MNCRKMIALFGALSLLASGCSVRPQEKEEEPEKTEEAEDASEPEQQAEPSTYEKAQEKAGAKPVYGIKMLLYQGAESFEIWTGKKAPIDVMQDALTKYLGL